MYDAFTDQILFDTVVNNLHTQGHKSYNDIIGCVYRSPEGRMCAVGGLIPDSEYRRSLEETSTDGVIDACPTLQRYNRALLFSLQAAHDNAHIRELDSAFVDVWGLGHDDEERGVARSLVAVAAQYELDDSLVTKLWPKTT